MRAGAGGFNQLPHDSRRRFQRHYTDNVNCELGEVLDMSATGLRIGCKGKPPVGAGQVAQVVLAFSGGKLNLCVRIVWIKRKGLRRFELGLHFINLTPKLTKALDAIATFGFIGPDMSVTAEGGATDSTRKRAKVRASVELPDYYETLDIPRRATSEQIREAFHKLALTCHPDVSKDPAAAQRFVVIKQAYEVLRDPAQRESYDLRRAG